MVMKDGMGMRYAFMGPMETIHLNAEGTQNYCDRYGETIYNVSSDSGPIPTAWRYLLLKYQSLGALDSQKGLS